MKMDALRWRTIYFIIIAFGTTYSKTVSDLCPKYWRYHKHTGTCVRKFTRERSFYSAKQYCEHLRGGPRKDKPGWLVTISDRDTDNFVKGLLTPNQKAYIGLTKENNTYVWVGESSANKRYEGWKKGYPRKSVYIHKYVVITTTGWENEYYDSSKYNFICQKYPAFSLPSFTCGSVEEDKPFPKLFCEYPIDETVGNFEDSVVGPIRVGSLMVCDSNLLCHSSGYLSGNIFDDGTRTSLTTELIVNRNVTRRDNNLQWSCSYKFDNTPDNLLVTYCKTKTYKLPENVFCGYSFPRSGGILFVCETTGGYPKFSSVWQKGNKKLGTQKGTHQESIKGGTVYFKSEFQWRFRDISEGTHNLYISMHPFSTLSNNEARQTATIVKTMQVNISVPERPPHFFVENDIEIMQNVLTVPEDQSVVLACEINGGSPEISQTFVQCDGKYVKNTTGKTSWSTVGQTVRITLLVTRAMDQQVCTCKGLHVSNQYLETSSITLNVRHAAELIRFQMNGRSQNAVQVYKKTRVNLACSTHGNPPPTLHIYKVDDKGEILTTLKNIYDTSVSLSIREASCDTSGIYVCAANNSLNSEISKREISLRVKCPPQPCSQRYSDREFYILPDTAATFRLCLHAYPAINPTIFIKHKDKPGLDKDTYSARFKYDNSLKTKGYVVVNMSQSVAEPGDYTMQLLQLKWNNVDFSLVPYPDPSCPEYLHIMVVSSRSVSLSWQPAADYDLPQTYTLTTSDSDGQVFSKQEVADNKQTLTSHNVTGLVPESGYKFALDVKNAQGYKECPQLTVNLITNALPVAAGTVEGSRAGVVAGAVVAVFIALLAICLLVFMILRRRRNSNLPKMPIWLRRGKKESKVFTEVTELKRASSKRNQQEPTGDIYSKVNKPKRRTVEREESVYTNKAAIEVHSKQQPVGSRGDPVVGFFAQRSYDDQRRASHDFDWSDAYDSVDDIDGDAETKFGACKMYDTKVKYKRPYLLRETHAEYVNSASIAETTDSAAVSDDNSYPPLPTWSETHGTPNGAVANRHIRDENNLEVVYSVPMKKGKLVPSKGRELVYIDVEVGPAADSNRAQSASIHLSAENLEESVDYASISYDADVSDSGTLGDAQL